MRTTMDDKILNRRALHRLALAALGGLAAGAVVGCSKPSANAPTAADKDKQAEATPRLLQDPHVCRGLNTCKNKGKKGTTNGCAAQTHRPTITPNHSNPTP